MSTERVRMKMQLTQEEYDLKRFHNEAANILNALRAELNPIAPIDELEMDRAEEMFRDLRAKWRVCRKLKENIAKLQEALFG